MSTTLSRQKAYDLDAVWKEACDSFARTTKYDLTKPPVQDPQQIIDAIAVSKARDEEKDKKYHAAKLGVQRFLTVVETFGGIAAQAASSAFPASGVCFNAVTCLISAGQNYSKIFICLQDLFGQISDVLERFTYYFKMNKSGDLDAPMAKICCDLVRSFIRTCELSIKVFRGSKVKLMAKSFFFTEDEGVSAEIQNLKSLVANEAQMKGTITLQELKQLHRETGDSFAVLEERTKDITKISSGMEELRKDQKDQGARKKQWKVVEDILGKCTPSDKQTFERFANNAVDRTGTWLDEKLDFRRWMNSEKTGVTVLALIGEQGFGKSHLSANVISRLEQRCIEANSKNFGRTLLAYAFFTAPDEKEKKPVAAALKSLVYQLCNDTVFLKDFSGYLEGTKKIDSWNLQQTKDIASKISKSIRRNNTTCYVVLDGVDQVKNTSDEQHRTLSWFITTLASAEDSSGVGMNYSDVRKPSDGIDMDFDGSTTTSNPVKAGDVLAAEYTGSSCLRILLSGAEDRVRELAHATLPHRIDLASNNLPDIRLFIEDHLNNTPSFKTQSQSAKFQDFRTEVLETLSNVAKGDFTYVEMLLEEISKKERPTAIKEFLDEVKTGTSRETMLDREVSRLNETLSADDLADANEILLLVADGIDSVTIAELEALLYLKNREPTLTSLTERIRSKFSTLFRIERDLSDYSSDEPDPNTTQVCMRYDYYTEYFWKKSDKIVVESESESTTKLNKSEVSIVKRFLKQVCDPELFEKFGFEEFFHSKLVTHDEIGLLERGKGLIKLVSYCLGVLRAPHDTNVDALRKHSITNLPQYLEWLYDPEVITLSGSERANIGKQLVEVLTTEDAIASFWKESNPSGYSIEELATHYTKGPPGEDSPTEVFRIFLDDSAVIRALDGEKSEWVKGLSSPKKLPTKTLEYVAIYMAKQWLEAEEMKSSLADSIDFLRVYLGALDRDTEPDERDVQPRSVSSIKDWVLNRLGLQELDELGLYNYGRGLMYDGDYAEAISQFELASSKIEDDWFVMHRIAIAHAANSEYSKAIGVFQPVLDKIEAGEATRADPQKHIVDLRRLLARYYDGDLQFDKACELYEAVQKENPQHSYNFLDLIVVYASAKTYFKTIDLLSSYAQEQDTIAEFSRLTRIFWDLYKMYRFHDTIGQAAQETEAISVVKAGYDAAFSIAKREVTGGKHVDVVAFSRLGSLSYFYGRLLQRYSGAEEDKALGVEIWEQCIELARPHIEREEAKNAIGTVAHELIRVYSERARQGGEAADSAIDGLAMLGDLLEARSLNVIFRDPRLPLARIFVYRDDLDAARDALRPQMNVCFALLSDEDPSNDYQAFDRLGTALRYINDRKNAVAAFTLLTPYYMREPKPTASSTAKAAPDTNAAGTPPADAPGAANGTTNDDNATASEEKTTENDPIADATEENAAGESSDTASTASEADEGPVLMYFCDGPDCDVEFPFQSDVFHCCDCLDTQFCRRHHSMLLAGEAFETTCNKTHDFLEMPPYDPKAYEGVPRDHVRVGDEVVPILEWINRLREEWGFPVQSVLDQDKKKVEVESESAEESAESESGGEESTEEE